MRQILIIDDDEAMRQVIRSRLENKYSIIDTFSQDAGLFEQAHLGKKRLIILRFAGPRSCRSEVS
jgi:DNA-binding NarL/FixJ family response regulator